MCVYLCARISVQGFYWILDGYWFGRIKWYESRKVNKRWAIIVLCMYVGRALMFGVCMCIYVCVAYYITTLYTYITVFPATTL